MSRRLNVLIVAHELSPYQGSECAEGWNLVTRLAKYHDITVLYASKSQYGNNNYEEAINTYFSKEAPISGLTLIPVGRPSLTRFIASLNSVFEKLGPIGLPLLYFLGYNIWQKAAYRLGRKLNRQTPFDVIHQLTQISFREPGYLWKTGIPFVWGPTGGTASLPGSYFRMVSTQFKFLEIIRSVSNYIQFNFVRRVVRANKKAALIYTFSPEDQEIFSKRAGGKVKLLLDAGTYSTRTKTITDKNPNEKLKGIWCGQLTERKAPVILLEALSLDPGICDKIDFKIIGSGPLRMSLMKKANELKLKNIEWIERVSHEEIFELMGKADLFVHTSLREATSNVIPEALSMGLPVICHDANGMSIAVNEECGIKIPLKSPENSIKGFYEAITRLISDRSLLNKLKQGTSKRSVEISWDVMAESIAKDYLDVVSEKTIQ
ncbi:MAG: glycosyltransferase family 4 protein [Bacteroidetes bacterium]|nr:glycosyltransferase family 4 protein [Bacteroidota bacterium]